MIQTEDIGNIIERNPEVFEGLKDEVIQKFSDWYIHPQNMTIINLFERETRRVKEFRKRDYFSARVIFEHIRWQTLAEDTNIEYKISNNVCSCIVRIVVFMNPDFEGMFRMRSRAVEEEELTI